MTRRRVGPIVLMAVAILATLVWVFPIYWTLITSLKAGAEIMSPRPTLYPHGVTIGNYRAVLFDSQYFTYLRNSLVVAGEVVLLTVVLSVGAAFALARLRFRGRMLIALLVLLVYLFPGVLLIVPLYEVMVKIGLYNRLLGIALTHILFTLPFGIWTLRTSFAAIPSDLEQAATIDGASRMQLLWRVYLPLAAPAVAVAAIFSFVVSWNEYMFALVMVSNDTLYTISVGIAAWVQNYTIDWGQLTAAAVMAIIPSAVFFWFLGGFFVRGLTEGAVKG